MLAMSAVDAELVPKLQSRDPKAVAQLLDRYWARAYRVAYQLTNDPGAAEDVAQETFVAVLRGVSKLKAGDPFRAWFFTILQNTAKKHHRSTQRRSKHEQRAAKAAVAGEPTAVAEDAEEAELVREHLKQLSPKLRHALALRYLEGLSLEEVARVLEIPLGTVSSRIKRGLDSLRESLKPALHPAFSVSLLADPEWLRGVFEVEVPDAPAPVEVVTGASGAAPATLPGSPAPAELLKQSARTSVPVMAFAAVGLVAMGAVIVGLALGVGFEDPQQQAAVGLDDPDPPAPPPRGASWDERPDDEDFEVPPTPGLVDRAQDAGGRAGANAVAGAGNRATGRAETDTASGTATGLRSGEFAFHYEQGYSFERQQIVPAREADVVFESCAGGISSVSLKAPNGIASLRNWSRILERRLEIEFEEAADGLPFPRLAFLAAVQAFDEAEGTLREEADGDDRIPSSDVFVLKTKSGAWVKLAIVARGTRGSWTEKPIAIRYVLNPERPEFVELRRDTERHEGFLLTPQPVLEALKDPSPFRSEAELEVLAARKAFQALSERVDEDLQARFQQSVTPPGKLGWVWRRDAAVQAGALDDYRHSTFSFEHATREDPQDVTRNDWDFLYDGQGRLRVNTVTDDRSKAWDLGTGGGLQTSIPASLPASVEYLTPERGHVYLIRTLDTETDTWTLLQVLDLVDGKLVFGWRSIPEPEVREEGVKVLNSPIARLQLRGGAAGGSGCRAILDESRHSHVDNYSPDPLDLTVPIPINEPTSAYVQGGQIPAGMVWVIESIEVTAMAAGDSNGEGEFLLQIGALQVIHMQEGKLLNTVTGEQRALADPKQPTRFTFRGQVVVGRGCESLVYAEISNSSLCDVVLRGRFVPADSAPAPPISRETRLHESLRFWLAGPQSPRELGNQLRSNNTRLLTLVRTILSFSPKQPLRDTLEGLLAGMQEE